MVSAASTFLYKALYNLRQNKRHAWHFPEYVRNVVASQLSKRIFTDNATWKYKQDWDKA